MKKNNKKGFTLAELLIVIAIIAVLVAIAIPVFTGAVNDAELAADKANVRAAYSEAAIDFMTDGTTITATELEAAAENDQVTSITGGTITFSDGETMEYDTSVVTGSTGS